MCFQGFYQGMPANYILFSPGNRRFCGYTALLPGKVNLYLPRIPCSAFRICKRGIHHLCQFPRFIILDFSVDIHRHFAVLVTGQVLHGFRIDSARDQICNICVPQQVRRSRKIQCVVNVFIRPAALPQFGFDRMVDPLPVYVPVYSPLCSWQGYNSRGA